MLVATDDDVNERIAGYYTLSSDNIRVDDLPAELVKRLKLPHYQFFGATLIGRLARDLVFKGQGMGELLLMDALKRSLTMSLNIASVAVIVDAKDDRAVAFYSAFGFTPFPETAKRLFLPMQTIGKLYPVSEG